MNLRQFLKRTLKGISLALTSPLYLAYRLLSIAGDDDSLFQSFSQLLSLIPGKPGNYLRASFYRLACTNTSDEISVGFLTVFSHRDTTICKGAYIGPQCNIGKCSIGENTLLGSGVHVLSGARQHCFSDTSVPIQQQGGAYEKIVIAEDCWLGNSSVVMASLERQTIVAAGSVVTKTSAAGDILAGNPAKLIKNRFENRMAKGEH